MEARTVLIVAACGIGISDQAWKLAALFGCTTVVDGWQVDSPIITGALHVTRVAAEDIPEALTNRGEIEVYTFDTAEALHAFIQDKRFERTKLLAQRFAAGVGLDRDPSTDPLTLIRSVLQRYRESTTLSKADALAQIAGLVGEPIDLRLHA
ncbi:MAG TPA: hypothetical protein VL381_00555 [Rhodocyclaceae bacterium]|nr:hypothetical protein [Rhodocyclaceae bacterium]